VEIIETILIAFGLAIDAFVVSVGAASTGMIDSKRAVFRLSFHFGLFQFMMPVLGWFAGESIKPIISSIDHWVAFILLQLVAFRMILLVRKDALAVGFSLAMLEINIWYTGFIIGVITGGMSLLGTRIGTALSQKLGTSLAILGGIILSLIGWRILLAKIVFL
jgi:putative Mn2+ efflux pump MntP